MKILSQISSTVSLILSVSVLNAAGYTEVIASLYDSITLPCSFPFIQGSEGLAVVWEKNDGERRIVHKYEEGQDRLENQHIDYTGRTELSKDFSRGAVELTLKDVKYTDEGTYFCRALNRRGHGDRKVKIIINDFSAEDAVVTVIHIDGKRRLKCIDIGMFRNPWVKWYDGNGNNLSEYKTRTITVLSDGRKMVESILDLDVGTNKHYFCQVKEGRLKRTTRAVISDGNPITVPETKLPD